MYKVMKQCIENKDYELSTIIGKIKKLWGQSEITDEQQDELIDLARANADPAKSYESMQAQIARQATKIAEQDTEISSLKGYIESLSRGETPVMPEAPETEEYPEFIKSPDEQSAYHVGDKITFNGAKYVCIKDGMGWSPEDYPAGWQIVIEDVI